MKRVESIFFCVKSQMGIKNTIQWRERIDTQPARKRAEGEVLQKEKC
jgi:hypothetical protein